MSIMSGTLDQVRDFVLTCGQSMGVTYHYQHVYHPYHALSINDGTIIIIIVLIIILFIAIPIVNIPCNKHLWSNNFVIIREMNIYIQRIWIILNSNELITTPCSQTPKMVEHL